MKRAKTKMACQIVGIDPLRFNEAVHAGHYPCAPQTVAGSARVFDENDMICLRIYHYLTGIKLAPSEAGKIACKVLEILRSEQAVEYVTVMWGQSGAVGAFAGKFDLNTRPSHPAFQRIAFEIGFDVRDLRQFVHEAHDYEASILGSE